MGGHYSRIISKDGVLALINNPRTISRLVCGGDVEIPALNYKL